MPTTLNSSRLPLALGLIAMLPVIGLAETEESDLNEVVVVGVTPLPGFTISLDRLPAAVQSMGAEDLKRDGNSNLLGTLSERLGSLNISDTLADPLQPDLLYRGFQASPVVGSSQGLAVYQDGVRINEAFGDAVNWDLFPDIAIDRLAIVSASPLYGLNALGGAVSITMKNAFTYQGIGAEVSGGSFEQRQAAVEFGVNDGRFGLYAAAHALNQGGWRVYAHDAVRQFYLDGSLRAGIAAIDLSFTRARNVLNGPGAAPVQSLVLDRTDVFTGPQQIINNLDFTRLGARLDLTNHLKLDGSLYLRNFRQTVSNGDNSDFTACSDAALLCQDDGATVLIDQSGNPIPDISEGGALILGQNDFEHIRSNGYGASIQLSSSKELNGHQNDFAVGASFDGAHSNFYSGTEVGVLNSALQVLPGYFLDTPEGTSYPATPVDLNADTKYLGFYLTDTFDLTKDLALTASARYNIAKIDLEDQRGTLLSGNNRYSHFNPALGATYQLGNLATVYAGYSINNRTPTASEIECSDPLRPCLLPSSLAADPPTLRQVIAHTAELGIHSRHGQSGTQLSWNIDLFRTDADDDIYGVATSLSTGVFQNIGATRRQGLEAGLAYQADRWSAFAQFSHVEATFQSSLTLLSPSNPQASAEGTIFVTPGDRLPLIPQNRLKIGADFKALPNWSVGASAQIVSGSYYRGDESNRDGQLPGYHPVTLRTSYAVGKQVLLFAQVQNLFDERYSTLGLYGDPTGVGAPGIPADAGSNDPSVDNRFQSPAMPRAYFAGIRLTF